MKYIIIICFLVLTSCNTKLVKIDYVGKKAIVICYSNTFFTSKCINAETSFSNSVLTLKFYTSNTFNEPMLKSLMCYKSFKFQESTKIEPAAFQINDGIHNLLPEKNIPIRFFSNNNWIQTFESLNCPNDTIVKILNGLDNVLNNQYKDEIIIKNYDIKNVSDLINLSFKFPGNADIHKVWALLYYIAYTETVDRIVFDFLNLIISRTSFHTTSLEKYQENIGIPPLWELNSMAKKEGITVDSLMHRY
jgi:hypothetical protein